MAAVVKVLVCGGRDFRDQENLYRVLDRLSKDWGPDVTIIEGDARGADRMAGYWARRHGHTDMKFRADWQSHGRAAGPIRNQQMLDEGPDMVVAFPGGRGTADMVRRARAAGVFVLSINP